MVKFKANQPRESHALCDALVDRSPAREESRGTHEASGKLPRVELRGESPVCGDGEGRSCTDGRPTNMELMDSDTTTVADNDRPLSTSGRMAALRERVRRKELNNRSAAAAAVEPGLIRRRIVGKRAVR